MKKALQQMLCNIYFAFRMPKVANWKDDLKDALMLQSSLSCLINKIYSFVINIMIEKARIRVKMFSF